MPKVTSYTWNYPKTNTEAQEFRNYRTLYKQCLKAAESISPNPEKSGEFSLIGDPFSTMVLSSLEGFCWGIASDTITCKDITYFGVIGPFSVYRDMTLTNNKIIISQNGKIAVIDIKKINNSLISQMTTHAHKLIKKLHS